MQHFVPSFLSILALYFLSLASPCNAAALKVRKMGAEMAKQAESPPRPPQGKQRLRHTAKRLPVAGVSLMQEKVVLSKNQTAVNVTDASVSTAAPTSFWMTEIQVLAHDEKTYSMLVTGATFVLGGVALCLAIAAALLMLACIYDGMSVWRHHARFRSCQKQLRVLHEAFHSKQGDLPLCPYCVEHISPQRSPKKIVFLCGHRFHVECSNRWYKQHPHVLTQCPVCVEDIHSEGCCPKAGDESPRAADGALAFMLKSLRRRYPEIISEECVNRWMSCHTEIWLSELTSPKYQSILFKHGK